MILGGDMKKMKKQFRSFTEARKFTHSLNLKNNKEWFNQVYKSTLKEIKDSNQVLHYGGYEIIVKDNETGKTVDEVHKGGCYPMKEGKTTTQQTRKTLNGHRF